MNDLNKTESREKLNERYFLALSNSRGSIDSFGLQSFVATVLAVLIFMIAGSYSKYSFLNGLNMSLIVIGSYSLLCFMITVSRLAYKFQLISSILMVIVTLFLPYFLIVTVFIPAFSTPTHIKIEDNITKIFIYLQVFSYIGSFVYNIIWMKKQLKVGFSKKRAQLNMVAMSSAFQSKSLWLIFGCSMLGAFLTGNLMTVFAFLFGTLISIVYPRLTVELSYLSYLRLNNQEYCEEIPAKKSGERTSINKLKILKWLYIVGSVVFVYGIDDFIHMSSASVVSILMWIIFISWIVMVILSIVKRIKRKNKK